jgi:hypothetical protein
MSNRKSQAKVTGDNPWSAASLARPTRSEPIEHRPEAPENFSLGESSRPSVVEERRLALKARERNGPQSIADIASVKLRTP